MKLCRQHDAIGPSPVPFRLPNSETGAGNRRSFYARTERDSVLEAQRIAFSPELEETWEWIVLDAKEEQILYAIQEKRINQEQMYSYRLTREIGIYDTAAHRSQVTAQWRPETPGRYQAGAVTGRREAPAVPEPWTIPCLSVGVCPGLSGSEANGSANAPWNSPAAEALTDGTVVFRQLCGRHRAFWRRLRCRRTSAGNFELADSGTDGASGWGAVCFRNRIQLRLRRRRPVYPDTCRPVRRAAALESGAGKGKAGLLLSDAKRPARLSLPGERTRTPFAENSPSSPSREIKPSYAGPVRTARCTAYGSGKPGALR